MNFSNRTLSIFTISLAVIILGLVLYPAEGGVLLHILRGIVFIGTLSLIYLVSKSWTEENQQSDDNENGFSYASEESLNHELKQHYTELIQETFNTIQAMNPAYESAVYMFDPSSDGYTLQEKTGDGFHENISGDNDIINSIMRQKEVIVLQQKDSSETWDDIFKKETWRGSECLLGTPIQYKAKPVGALILKTNHFSKIGDQDRDMLKNIGDLFTMGMSRLETIEELMADNYYHTRVAHLFDSLEISSTEQDLHQSVVRMCRTFFQYDKLTINSVDVSEKQGIVCRVDGESEDMEADTTFPLEYALHGLPIVNGTSINEREWEQTYPNFVRFRHGENSKTYDSQYKSIVAVPIIHKETIKGSIALERRESRPFSKSDQHLLEFLGTTVGSLQTWIEEYQKMHISSIHDGLTGLLNHAAFMVRFDDEINRAIRFDQKLVLIIFDLDKFKRINDTYGHTYGDHVLKTIAGIIKDSVRNIDVVARYGGEEFVVILVNTDTENSLPVAQRIIERIADHRFTYKDEAIRMTISGGMSEFPSHSDEIKGLIDLADEAMYATKGKGGNGVMIYSESITETVGE